MKLLLVTAISQILLTSAFLQPVSFRQRIRLSPQHVASVDPGTGAGADTNTNIPITVTGNNIDVTDALVDYVKKKLERPLGKLRANGAIKDCEVHLSVNKNPKVKDSHRIEVTTALKGTTIRSTEATPDMYASIDAVSDRLTRKLRKYKERRLNGFHGGGAMGADLASALEQLEEQEAELMELNEATSSADLEEDMEDPYAPKVTKIKSFDLSKPISLQEAIFALDYLDHDFYFFRDEATNELSVVYKRNAGGIGLIQPQ